MYSFARFENTDAVTIKLLKHLGFDVSSEAIVSELEKHPDYPSFLAVSDVLNWFGIKTAAYRVNEIDLKDIEEPFIASTNRNNDFLLVHRVTADKIVVSDEKKSYYDISASQFEKIYNGTILVADLTESRLVVAESNWTDRFKSYKTPLAAIGLITAFLIILLHYTNFSNNLTWQILCLIVFKIAGLITSIILLTQSINKNNPLIQAICGGNSKTNCNAILTSKAAIVFKGLTWSEVGFFYFAGSFLSLLFVGSYIGGLSALALLNTISLPYTVYSINYQLRIAKQWCVLCCTVQALLWLEFVPLFSYIKDFPAINNTIVVSVLICFIIPISLWLILKPLLNKAQEVRTLKYQLQKTKYHKGTFESLLKEQPKYSQPADDWSIVLGNTEANTIITMVSNPYCGPCSSLHKELEEWLNRLDNVQIRIVFTANNKEHDKRTPIVRHLMALNELPDKNIIKHALDNWYGQKEKNYEIWAKKYPVVLDESKFIKLEKQRSWCNITDVKATPTLLINGYRLPQVYRLHDIKYMLD